MTNNVQKQSPIAAVRTVVCRMRAGLLAIALLLVARTVMFAIHGRFDTIFVKDFPAAQTISGGLTIACVRFFFSFSYMDKEHCCVLVTDYPYEGTTPDTDTGMWIVHRPTEPKV